MYRPPGAGPGSWKRLPLLQVICHPSCNDASLPASDGHGSHQLGKHFTPRLAAVLSCSLGSAGYWGTAAGTGAMPSTGCSSAALENIALGFLGVHHPL